MENSNPSPWYAGKHIFIVLGAIFLVAALLLLLVPRLLDDNDDNKEAKGVVTAFIEAAAAGDADLAVGFHSSRANYRKSLADLIRSGGYGQILEGYESVTCDSSQSVSADRGPTVALSGSVNFTDRPSANLTANLIEESGSWKIQGFDIGAARE